MKDKADRLMIIDPDRPENNISGGTQNIGTICQCFAEAHRVLGTKLAAWDYDPSSTKSFLESILGCNYTAYERQRDILYELHYGTKRNAGVTAAERAGAVLLPNSNTMPHEKRRVDDSAEELAKAAHLSNLHTTTHKKRKSDDLPGASEISALLSNPETTPQGTRSLNRNERRAARMKALRPDLAHRIPDSISSQQGAKIGGYKNISEYTKDMADREFVIAQQDEGTRSIQ